MEAKFQKVEDMPKGTIFLEFQDVENRIGLVYDKWSDDRVSGTTFWIYDNNERGDWTPHSMSSEHDVLLIDTITVSKNPLRDLVLWRSKYGG